MSVQQIIGMEVGDLGEFSSTTGSVAIESTTINTGAYSLRCNPTTTAVGWVATHAIGSDTWLSTRFYFRAATLPASGSEPLLSTISALPAEVRVLADGSLRVFDDTTALGVAGGLIEADQWYRIDVLWGTSVSGSDDEVEVYIDGVLATSVTGVDIVGGSSTRFYYGKRTDRNGQTVDFFYDDILTAHDASKPAILGAGGCIARSPITGGTPTYDAWTKSSGSDAGALWNDTPFNTGDSCEDAGDAAAAQTADIADVSATQSGHGSEVIAAGDTINGAIARLVASRGGGSAGMTLVVRNRINSVDDDLNIGDPTTTNTLQSGNILTPSVADLDIVQIGGVRAGTGNRNPTIYDVWLMVDFSPAPPAGFLMRSAQLNQAVKRASYH